MSTLHSNLTENEMYARKLFSHIASSVAQSLNSSVYRELAYEDEDLPAIYAQAVILQPAVAERYVFITSQRSLVDGVLLSRRLRTEFRPLAYTPERAAFLADLISVCHDECCLVEQSFKI